jgi:hypothetical protein
MIIIAHVRLPKKMILNTQTPTPSVWSKKAEVILQKINHCKAVTETLP